MSTEKAEKTCADTGQPIERSLDDQCAGCYLESQPTPCVTDQGSTQSPSGAILTEKLWPSLPLGLDSPDQMLEPFCACGRVISCCDGSRRQCHTRTGRGLR